MINAGPKSMSQRYEVVAAHPPVGLGEGEPGNPVGRRSLGAGEHRGELLGHPDRRHPGPAGHRLGIKVGPHHLNLAVGLAEPHHRDVVVTGELRHRLPERQPDLLEDRRGGNRIPRCWVKKLTTCPPTCSIGTYAFR